MYSIRAIWSAPMQLDTAYPGLNRPGFGVILPTRAPTRLVCSSDKSALEFNSPGVQYEEISLRRF